MSLPAESSHQFEGEDHADLYLKSRPEWPQEIIQRSLQYLLVKKSPPLTFALDVGCGSGQNTIPLAQHFEKVVGVDVSISQIGAARRRTDAPTNVEFQDDTVELLVDSTMALFVKYVRSWAGYQNYKRQKPQGQDLAKDLQDKLMDIMGLDASPEGANIKLKLPVTLLLGRKPNP